MQNEVLQVSEFQALINQTLAFAYPEVIIEGEVSGFKLSQQKWVFFDLKDSQCSVGCFMSVFQLKHKLEDGMKIRVTCNPTVTKWGKFSLTVRHIELAGEGSVKRAFELLRAELEKEGLFSVERKRPLVQFPKKIGLLTSKQAAAYNDFRTIIDQRWGGLDITHYQVQVQGEGAVEQIQEAIEWFNASVQNFDVLVIIRGGGSQEDLAVFNTEQVTRAVFGSKIPTLVAIGHEDDVSLAELAADVRAATPTDAATKLVPNKLEYFRLVESMLQTQDNYLQARLKQHYHGMDRYYGMAQNYLNNLSLKLESNIVKLSAKLEAGLINSNHSLKNAEIKLNGLNPNSILARGYAIASIDGVVIHSPNQITNKPVLLRLHKGDTLVNKYEKGKND